MASGSSPSGRSFFHVQPVRALPGERGGSGLPSPNLRLAEPAPQFRQQLRRCLVCLFGGQAQPFIGFNLIPPNASALREGLSKVPLPVRVTPCGGFGEPPGRLRRVLLHTLPLA